MYQARFALLKLLELPEDTSVLIEKDDDLDFVVEGGRKTLASLKHKGAGQRLSNLSKDFWKSVVIWLERYKRDGRIESSLNFFLFTTDAVSENSFLTGLLPNATHDAYIFLNKAEAALIPSESAMSQRALSELNGLKDDEKTDFIARISIFDSSPRITEVPSLIADRHMRTIRREFRKPVLERLEGWWTDQIIRILAGDRTEALSGFEVSDKMASLADEYKLDNLPIHFRGKTPSEAIDPDADSRCFVVQLREIGISSDRIQSAILDYYRAFEQRSMWARENVLLSDEIELYEERLIDEWRRYRDVILEQLDPGSQEAALVEAGKEIYRWAEFETNHLRIRERVTEAYVVRGGFHILANDLPTPRIYWHPQFLQRIGTLLGVSK
jgi:hypothetical protein